jgi:hypothetical protein
MQSDVRRVVTGASVYVSAAVPARAELFATRIRFSGFSVGYDLCAAMPSHRPTIWSLPR